MVFFFWPTCSLWSFFFGRHALYGPFFFLGGPTKKRTIKSYGSAAMIGVVRVSSAVDGRGISDYDWGIFFILVTLDLCLLLIHRDLWNSQKCQILISVNRDLDLFLIFLRFCSEKPPPPPLFKVFVYGKGVQNIYKFTNIFFFNFHLYFRRHSPLMPPS